MDKAAREQYAQKTLKIIERNYEYTKMLTFSYYEMIYLGFMYFNILPHLAQTFVKDIQQVSDGWEAAINGIASGIVVAMGCSIVLGTLLLLRYGLTKFPPGSFMRFLVTYVRWALILAIFGVSIYFAVEAIRLTADKNYQREHIW